SLIYMLSLHDALPILYFLGNVNRCSFTSFSKTGIIKNKNREVLEMQVEKNTSFSQKVMKKAIQLSVGSTLLEWPPFCLTFDYQRSEEHTSELQSRFDL